LEVQIQLNPKQNDKKIGAIKDASLKANKKKKTPMQSKLNLVVRKVKQL
jgi:hypothetical protein